jgi:excisionase family DNA binding protein
MNEWLTLEEAAAHLKVARRTLAAWARLGKVKGYLLSGTIRHVWRFRREDLDAMLLASSAGSADRRQQ